MASIYIHIPFCKQACTYCDFHFSTSTKGREGILDAIEKELRDRLPDLEGQPIGSIYFGGGTPSVIPIDRIDALLQVIRMNALVEADVEVTLEADPDDMDRERISTWKSIGIDRLSIGVQSFNEDQLRWMGRAHDRTQALDSLGSVAEAGLRSWTMDLIYGLPGMDLAAWVATLDEALQFSPPHISAYNLTVEPRTALHRQVDKGIVALPDDQALSEQFEAVAQHLGAAGLIQYEISNFGREGHFSRHNTTYWSGSDYLGIGPSAHSFLRGIRRWNIANNARYMKGVMAGEVFWETEELSPAQRTNELLMTGLRTIWGVDLKHLPLSLNAEQRATIAAYSSSGHLTPSAERLVLTERGKLIADRIASDLFLLS